MKSKIYQLIEKEIKSVLDEYITSRSGGLSMHPFDNHLANQPNRTKYENLYDDLSDAIIMKMISAYGMDQVKEITRDFAKQASQGPGGIGGRFTDLELGEVMDLVFDKLKDAFNVDLRSEMPEDREHPQYLSDD
jgi:hypothetical protein